MAGWLADAATEERAAAASEHLYTRCSVVYDVAVIDPDHLVLISVDDHTVELPDMFKGRVPSGFANDAPRIVTDDTGVAFWEYAGAQLPNIGLNAVAGRPTTSGASRAPRASPTCGQAATTSMRALRT